MMMAYWPIYILSYIHTYIYTGPGYNMGTFFRIAVRPEDVTKVLLDAWEPLRQWINEPLGNWWWATEWIYGLWKAHMITASCSHQGASIACVYVCCIYICMYERITLDKHIGYSRVGLYGRKWTNDDAEQSVPTYIHTCMRTIHTE